MTRPRLHPAARVEYVEALLYLEAQREGYGERFEVEIEATLDRIRDFPQSGALIDGYPRDVEARAFPLRRFRYTVMVVLEAEGPLVYAVAHQNRRPGYWHDRSR
jgi:plasmid stabilization system protein ParE